MHTLHQDLPALTVINPLTDDEILTTKIEKQPGETLHHTWLYALKLEDRCYYVGKTTKDNPHDRIQEHMNGEGARWTKRHKFLAILEIRDIGFVTKAQATDLENELTLLYMRLLGYKKVRGGYIVPDGEIFDIFDRLFWGRGLRYFVLASIVILISGGYLLYTLYSRIWLGIK